MYINISTITSLIFTIVPLVTPISAAAIDGHCTSIIHVKRNLRRAGATHTYDFEVPGLSGDTDNCILTSGDRGSAVEALQRNLNGCYAVQSSDRIETDGKFGSKTAALLKKAQRGSGANDDGKYGPETRNKISFWGVTTTSGGQVLFTCGGIF